MKPESHPNIEQPDDGTVIWRYIDLWRFLSLLHSRSLFLCRLDLLRDSWEGSWPQSTATALKASLPDGQSTGLLKATHDLRVACYVSCWHESPTESAALWDLYSGQSGLAIRSTVGSLAESIDVGKQYYVGRVRYIDFDEEGPLALNLLVPPFLKRKSFEHEREVRVLHWDIPFGADGVEANKAVESHALFVDPNTLIEELYVAPKSPRWVLSALQEVCKRFDLSAEVRASSLYDPRIY